MNITYTKDFIKSYKKLNLYDKKAVEKTLRLFAINPQNPKLRNHLLKGDKSSIRSIDVKFDLRILFSQEDDYINILILDIGTHSQLYG
jgi:addiction module RelE/StbE family toxin